MLLKTFTYNDKVYSVDMMIAYVNIHKPKTVYVDIYDYVTTFEEDWYDDDYNEVPAIKVLEDINNPKYSKHLKRVYDCDTKYPIIIYDDHVIDGCHRMIKTVMRGKSKIKACILSKKVFEATCIRNEDEKRNFELYEYIQMFKKRLS